MTILSVEHLCKRYPGFALEDVSFSMEQGTVMGFIGRNGAGKTTTIKSILRLVRPDSGRITVCGMDAETHEREIRARIGYVSGSAAYYPRRRLRALTAVTASFYPAWDSVRCAQLMQRFGLDEDKRVSELSEGMKVKYQLALAMSHGAELLILDEPTSGLDPVSRDELLQMFVQLCDKEGVSIFFSTHITTDLDTCADRITWLRDGRVAASGPLDAFRAEYVLARGPEAQLTDALRAKLIGATVRAGQAEGLLHAADAPLAAGLALQPADLTAIMVHLEREAEP